MMKDMARRFSGTAYVRVSGDTSRFLNVMIRSGIFPLDMRTEEETLYVLIRAKHYKKLHAIKLRTHTKVRLERKEGLPFALRRIRKRPGILVGMFFAVLLYMWLSGFYWCVDIAGEAPYARSVILSTAQECGVYVGAKKNVDLPTAANQFMRALPNISWASFNSDGCRVTLDFHPAVQREAPLEKGGAYDIVARHDGLIRKITAQNGTVIIKTGSAVKAGQTLVSGVAVIGDPWDPEQEVRHLLSHARAQIIAETYHTFTASCPLTEETAREVYMGERKVLCVLKWRIPLSLTGAISGSRDIVKKSPVSILDTDLPLWVETQRCFAEEPMNILQENYLGKTGKILSEELSYSEKEGVVYAVSHCTVEEDIALEVPMGGTS